MGFLKIFSLKTIKSKKFKKIWGHKILLFLIELGKNKKSISYKISNLYKLIKLSLIKLYRYQSLDWKK